ncbi:MAG TPA: methyl-accepting chemotaxis protein [Rhodocyclaceae bacterium]
MGILENMFGGGLKEGQVVVDQLTLDELRGQIAAINKSQGVIEFSLDGTVLHANENFLAVLGYRLDEIKGKHHSMFVDGAYRQSPEYRQFWDRLGRGEYDAGQYKRIGKGGREVWIQASYNPILDSRNKPFKVVKYATDITTEMLRNADSAGQLAAISKSQGVIEFTLDGTVLNANANFLAVLGYSLDEVKGKHHSLFVDPAYRQSAEYRQFWEKLGRGEYDAGRYMRIGKGGREVWIQASYNPILDLNGQPCKVVKYATDITAQVNAANALQRTVDETQAMVNAAVAGDLTKRIPMGGKSGMLEALCGGVNSLVDTMAGIVRQIQSAAGEVLTGTREIAKGNQDLSSRTEEQASSLEETASSMEELSATVKQNADNAKQANELAQRSNEAVARGGESVKRVVATMSDIQDSSKKIADIIGVIDSIAFQTNILALNAAVEAARAGEQGRGFAVVATEVRNLAQRSATAAKEIKELISASVDKVESGAKQVAQAGTAMDEVVTSFGQVAVLVTGITNASREQASGIEQVTKAVSQMDEVTQQNAALVEEAAAAAESLEEQAKSLVEAVSRFDLGESGQQLPRRAAAAIPGSAAGHSAVRPHSANPVRKISAPRFAAAEDQWEEF